MTDYQKNFVASDMVKTLESYVAKIDELKALEEQKKAEELKKQEEANNQGEGNDTEL